MIKILYIVLLISLFSCKSNSIAQVKENKNTTPKVEKPKFSDIQDVSIEPNTVHLIAVIQNLHKDGEFCSRKFKITVDVTVKRIINSGSGIVNMISPEQNIVFGVTNSPAYNFESLQQDMKSSKQVFFKVREGLCPDMSKTIYEVVRYQ